MEEQVLVVDRKTLEEKLGNGVFLRPDMEELRRFLNAAHYYLPRSQAEQDRTAKQIIPYVVIRRGQAVFLLRRLKKQTEKRLHDKLSLGVGGHINPTEDTAPDPLEAGLWRELNEEVSAQGKLTWAGVLNENDGGVSDFHAGLVCLLDTEEEVFVRETEKMSGRWVEPEELRQLYPQLETWSRLVVDHLLDI